MDIEQLIPSDIAGSVEETYEEDGDGFGVGVGPAR